MTARNSTGFILAAPASGAGKTTVTLGLLRALARRGLPVRGAKSGPDYIDPRFHEAACGQPCLNLDAWAMEDARLKTLAQDQSGLLLIEGAMGLFDGAPPLGKGATADLARILNLPVVLVVDAARTAQSIAPLVAGFAAHDAAVRIAGVILNNVGSPRHETMLRAALDRISMPVFGAVHRQATLAHPSRHLGLVQAGERRDLDDFLNTAADVMDRALDIDALLAIAAPLPSAPLQGKKTAPAQNIAIASDAAFAFAYPHHLADWRAAGATVSFFSPLANEPAPKAAMIFLPGGYPELHAAQLAAADLFKASIRQAAQDGTVIYGECGGYMVLGESLTDAQGQSHEMLGLLPLETSFAKRRLQLGYRQVHATSGPFTGPQMAHEFHYATTLRAEGPTLFSAKDAQGTALPDMGLKQGAVCGSFAHLIDRSK